MKSDFAKEPGFSKPCQAHDAFKRLTDASAELKDGSLVLSWVRKHQGAPTETQNAHVYIYIYLYIYICIIMYLYIGLPPFPGIVTTKSIMYLIGNSYKPSFATKTGKGDISTYTCI